jgi:endoglucanase
VLPFVAGCLITILAISWFHGQPTPLLRVTANRLVGARGNTIRLLGINRSGTEYACIQGWGFTEGPMDQRAIAAMTSWRVNAVRLPLNEDCWLGINGTAPRYAGAHYRAAIRAFVAALRRAGLFVILDLHWSAPGVTRATGQEPMADLDHSPRFWWSVARTFKSDSGVMFDLFNEPREINWPCWRDGCVVPEGWRAAGMQTLVDAVRSTGARQPIILTGIESGADLSSWLKYRPSDPAHQLIAGFHAYNFTGCATLTCWRSEIRPVFAHVPVVAAELGEGSCSDVFIDRFMNWADTVGVSYLGWTWNPSGCSAPSLITSWNGTPTAYGVGLRDHLLDIRQRSSTPGGA